jgi:hypothetical protein
MLLKEVFIFLHEKLILHFLSAIDRCFWEGVTKIRFDNWTKPISKNSRPLRVKIHHLVQQ